MYFFYITFLFFFVIITFILVYKINFILANLLAFYLLIKLNLKKNYYIFINLNTSGLNMHHLLYIIK